MDKLERLLVLLMTLLEAERLLRADEIRERVPGYPERDESFQRAFERDKDDLREMGVPVVLEPIAGAEPGAVGYRVDRRQYYLEDPGLAPDELAALHLATTLVRVGDVAGIDALRTLGGLPGLATGARDPLVALPDEPNLQPLYTAIVERRVAHFSYRGEQRRLEPHRVDFQRGWWYVSGFDRDRGELRNFRIDRIEGSVDLGDRDAFARPADRPRGPAASGWELPADDPVTARLRVDADTAPWAEQLLGAERVTGRDDGAVEFTVEVRNRAAFRSFVLTFLDHATVVEPPELAAELVAWLEPLAGGGADTSASETAS
jgi:proteasome accessory factor B